MMQACLAPGTDPKPMQAKGQETRWQGFGAETDK